MDKFDNWFLPDNMLSNLFLDIGVPDTITSDSSSKFKLEKLRGLCCFSMGCTT